METNQTTNYQLNQWEPTDAVQSTDFNSDNAKIDAALAGLETAKADNTSLENLSLTVTNLSSAVEGHTEALTKLGNCYFYNTSYVGNGQDGNWNATPNSLTFPHTPYLVAISATDGAYLLLFRGSPWALAVLHPQYAHQSAVSWSGNTVTWYTTSGLPSSQMNEAGVTYQVLALLAADE